MGFIRTMSNERTKVPSDDAVPGRALSVVKGLLDVLGDVLLDVVFAHGFLC